MNKLLKLNDQLKTLARDTRGGALVETLIVVVCVALFCIACFSYLGEQIDTKTRDTADRVVNEIQ